jgi:ferrous iron transport protein A
MSELVIEPNRPREIGMTTLSDLTAGARATITGLSRDNSHYRRKLLAMGLTPHTTLAVIRVAPLGDPIEVQARGCRMSLRRDEAQLIQVETC